MDKPSNTDNNLSSYNADADEDTNSPKARLRTRGKKRKRKDSESSIEFEGILPDNVLEVERNLQASAIKNNLDDASVKKILKKVVTNDHVLALVKLREEEELSCNIPEQITARHTKITRAKAKELMKVSPKSAPWNLELTPIKHIPVKTRPEVKALIAQELPEDEDDEEYEPTHDDVPSDDDQVSCSDLDSQPRTPATPSSLHSSSPRVVKDGPFKVPQNITTPSRRKLIIVEEEEEATIALRTRSKLSLSATPIEHIESSFIPPDDIPTPVGDDLWNQFLEECLNPAEVSKNEEDDEADPEYNVAADPDAHDEDEEALENSLIKISKKELNDLVTELFSILPEDTDDQLAADLANNVLADHNTPIPSHWESKQEPISDEETDKTPSRITFKKRNSVSSVSIGKIEPEDYIEFCERDSSEQDTVEKEMPRCVTHVREGCSTHTKPKATTIHISVEENIVPVVTKDDQLQPPPVVRELQEPSPTTEKVTIEIDKSGCMLPEQVQIIEQHLRQHIQLATSNFLQLYVNPIHWNYAPSYKEYLVQFEKILEDNPKSVVNVCNLKPALELVRSWEKSVSQNTPENQEMVEFMQKEADRSRRRNQCNNIHVGDFPEMFKRVIANSSVFLYPYLLPPHPYRPDILKRFSYRRSEDELIVLGLDQFWRYIEQNPDLFPPPSAKHPRHRWGLTATIRLVTKHMFPWITPRWMLLHVSKGRKDKDGPIYNYFKNGTIEPVKHRLLPFNPNLTLYEQPEHEMPRIWVRYLAKSSKRFKDFLYKRKDCGQPADGVLIDLGTVVATPQKAALPIDFTKVIECTRGNLLPKISAQVYRDKFDIEIENNVHMSNNESNQANGMNNTGKVITAPLMPNFGNISVTNVLPANAKVLYNLIPVVKTKIPVKNIEGNNAIGKVTITVASTIGNATLSNGVTNNNANTTQILPTGISQEDKTENNANNALTDTGDAIDKKVITVVQMDNTVVKEMVSKRNEEILNTGMNQMVTDAVDSKLLTNTTQTISGVTTNALPINKGEICKTCPSMTPTNKICTHNVTANVQNVNTNEQNTSNATPSNMYTLIKTSAGSYLIPLSLLQKTNTVNSVTAPIVSTGITTDNAINVTVLNKNTTEANKHSLPRNKNDYLISDNTHKELKNHCQCCIILRKICKQKQACITDYFTLNKNKEKTCECTDRKYPKTTKRLRLFLKNYKSNSWCVHKELQSKLKLIKNEMHEERASTSKIESLEDEYSLEDIAFVTSYQLKLTTRSNVVRDMAAKRKIQRILSNFDHETDSVIRLTEELYKAFGTDLVDLYKEFLGFLTAEQANRIDMFRDYFLHSCIGDLIKKIESEISDNERKHDVLTYLNELLVDRVSTSCQMCTSLLVKMNGYPTLARHVFSLFPHRADSRKHNVSCSSKTSIPNTRQTKPQAQTSKQSNSQNTVCTIIQSCGNNLTLIPNPQTNTDEEMADKTTRIDLSKCVEEPNATKDNQVVQPESTENKSHIEPSMNSEETDDFIEDSLTICDDNFVTMNYEADNSSSGEDDTGTVYNQSNSNHGPRNSVIKNEDQPTMMDTSEITISKTEVQGHIEVQDHTEDLPTMAMSEEILVKTEVPEWKRDEDKLILQILLQYLSPSERKGKTILEILDEKNVYQMLSESVTHKTRSEIKDRVMYLLDILVML